MSGRLDEVRAELKLRQGKGARYHTTSAPLRELDWARRGTAYFARLLNHLSDLELEAPSSLPGLSRSHVVAHCGYQARHLGEFVAAARAASALGGEGRLPVSAHVDWSEIDGGATLPARALRNLFTHTAVHLDVEWRDTEAMVWDTVFADATGLPIALKVIPAQRAISLWSNAFDLNAGGRIEDFPVDLRQFLVLGGLRMRFNLGG